VAFVIVVTFVVPFILTSANRNTLNDATPSMASSSGRRRCNGALMTP
jgi:hypothetical protein